MTNDAATAPAPIDLAAATKAELVSYIMRREGARFARDMVRKGLMRRTKAELIERASHDFGPGA